MSESDYIKVIRADDLAPGECREVLAGRTAVALCNVDGTFHAVSNRCAHRGGPLGQGMLDGAVLMCPWHAWTFDVRTGESTVNAELKVASYPVRVEGGDVLVGIPTE